MRNQFEEMTSDLSRMLEGKMEKTGIEMGKSKKRHIQEKGKSQTTMLDESPKKCPNQGY